MAERPGQDGPRACPCRWVAAALLLAALPVIGLGIYLTGRGGGRPGTSPPGDADALDLISHLPLPAPGSPLKVTTPPKQWPAERMYEKINGEDVAYLKHGCVGLAAATLTDPADGNTIDLYLYQMASPAAAEKVFTEQAPSQDAPSKADRPQFVEVADKAYLSYGCCYVRAGCFYLKLIVGNDSPAAAEATLKLARAFAARLEEKS